MIGDFPSQNVTVCVRIENTFVRFSYNFLELNKNIMKMTTKYIFFKISLSETGD